MKYANFAHKIRKNLQNNDFNSTTNKL